MIKFSRLLPIVLLSTLAPSARAQKSTSYLEAEVTGRPIGNSKYQHVIGSPYLFDKWLPGEVVTAAGKLHKGMLLKYNTETNLLTFVYKEDEEPLKFAEPIAGFTLFADSKMSFMNNFAKVDGNGKDAFYEVLATGKVMLLKHYKQFVKETRGADLAKTDGTYVQKVAYYISKEGKISSLKPDLKYIEKALADKTAEIDGFIVAKNISIKNEEGLKAIIDYYNGL